MIEPGKPLDLASMTEDELFDVLGLSDMDAGERLNFLRHMSAWSHAVIPSPGMWWRHAAIVAANWRSQLNWHVDQLIADALGSRTED